MHYSFIFKNTTENDYFYEYFMADFIRENIQNLLNDSLSFNRNDLLVNLNEKHLFFSGDKTYFLFFDFHFNILYE